ncbi:alpha/beta fold hydrolase [Candidatus Saccharibacteria bacterium]|nr:alpha/beta fold hydrolase [Candidatus Saccharibacteria bacterium]
MKPDQFTLKETMLPVGNGHRLYVQLWGDPNAEQTLIWLHGGPGSGSRDEQKDLFDPKRHRVIFYDQRGCGRSRPYGSLRANKTDDQVADLSKILDAFSVDSCTLVGGSWGSLLALVYAIRNPKRVKRMVLRGIFTGRQSEVDFVDGGGCREFFPEVWEQFVTSVPSAHRMDPAGYLLPRLFGKYAEQAKRAAFAFNMLEGSLTKLDYQPLDVDFDTFDLVNTIIEQWYVSQGCFLPDSYILDNAALLTMPIDIVQGRYDMVCPPITAYELHQRLPNSRLTWTLAGHSWADRANLDAVKNLL